jgi:hypothetical protein
MHKYFKNKYVYKMDSYKYSRGDKLIYQGMNITIVNASHGSYDVVEGWLNISELPPDSFLQINSDDIDSHALIIPYSAFGAGRKKRIRCSKKKRRISRKRTRSSKKR